MKLRAFLLFSSFLAPLVSEAVALPIKDYVVIQTVRSLVESNVNSLRDLEEEQIKALQGLPALQALTSEDQAFVWSSLEPLFGSFRRINEFLPVVQRMYQLAASEMKNPAPAALRALFCETAAELGFDQDLALHWSEGGAAVLARLGERFQLQELPAKSLFTGRIRLQSAAHFSIAISVI